MNECNDGTNLKFADLYISSLYQEHTRALINVQNQVPSLHILIPTRRLLGEATLATNYFHERKRKRHTHGTSTPTAGTPPGSPTSSKLKKHRNGNDDEEALSATTVEWAKTSPSPAEGCLFFLCNDVLIIAHAKDKTKVIRKHMPQFKCEMGINNCIRVCVLPNDPSRRHSCIFPRSGPERTTVTDPSSSIYMLDSK